MILDIFKPAWQSTNPTRRRRGIQKLDPNITMEADTLYSLASTDPEQSVRLTAIERISNITLLARLLKNAPTSLEQDKLGRLLTQAALVETTDMEGLSRAIDLIDMDDDLYRIAVESVTPQAQLQAVKKIRDEKYLLKIALHHPAAKLRLVAAQRVNNIDFLMKLLEHSKGKDKSIWRTAKEKIDADKLQKAQLAEQRAKATRIFEDMSNMENKDIDSTFKQKWKLLQHQWQELPEDDRKLFDIDPLIERINVRIQAFAARRQEQSLHLASRKEAEEEQTHALALLNEALEVLKNTETDKIDLPSLRATLKTQVSRWQAAGELNQPSAQHQAHFERDSRKLAQAIESVYTLRKHIHDIKLLHEEIHQTAPDDLARNHILYGKTELLIKQISWPKDVITPKDMQRLTTDFQCLVERERRQSDILEDHKIKLTDQFTKLENVLNSGQLNDADNYLKGIQKNIRKLPDKHAEPFRNQLKPLQAKFADLKDWQTFAAQPKKEALILSMEGLAGDTGEIDPSVRLDYIQKLQSEWREIGRLAATVESQLWERFQAASKAAYAPCKAFYEEQANTRERNKLHKEKMCLQLEEYIANYNWGKADWNSVQELSITAREEWKRHVPVDRKSHKALEERFQGLIQQINARLNAHKESNERIKQRLLNQAKELLQKEDLDAAIETMKALRNDWRAVGMLPSNTFKAINQEFFDAYNELMSRKQQQWSDVSAQKQNNAQQIADLLDTADALLSENDQQKLLAHKNDLQHIDQAFSEFSPLHENDQQKLRQRFQKLSKSFNKALIKAKNDTRQRTLLSLWHRSKILRKLEAQVLGKTATDKTLRDITEEWNQIPETQHHAMARLNARFDTAIHAYANNGVDQLLEAAKKVDHHAKELCIMMEILADLESAEEDADLRIQLQVNRLNQSLQTRGDDSNQNEHESLILEWCNTGPLSPDQQAILEHRFDKAQSTFDH